MDTMWGRVKFASRNGALDLLMVTDLSPKEFIYGKLLGILYNTKEYLLPPLLLAGVYAYYQTLAVPPEKMDALLLVAATKGSVGVDWDGDFHLDRQGKLTKRQDGEKADFVYSGVGIIKPQLFGNQSEDVFRLAPFLFEAAQKGRLYGMALDGQWLHVGTPAAIGEAEAAIARAKQ